MWKEPRQGWCCGKEKKQGGMWVSCCLVFNAMVKRGNKVVCGLHTALFLMPQWRREMRWCVGSTLPHLQCPREKGKQGGVWALHCLVFNAPEKRRSEVVCGLHAASSLMQQKRGETRQCVDSMPPHLQCPRKERKWGRVWTLHCLIFSAAEKRKNEVACGLHTTSSLMPQEG